MRLLRRFIAWLLSPFRRRPRVAPERQTEEPRWSSTAVGEDFPDLLEKRVLYLVGEDEYWFAAMLCPCGCGDSIQLSLLPNDYPTWRLHLEQDRTPTLSPSVWRKKGCRSHFHLRGGTIQWCTAAHDNLVDG